MCKGDRHGLLIPFRESAHSHIIQMYAESHFQSGPAPTTWQIPNGTKHSALDQKLRI